MKLNEEGYGILLVLRAGLIPLCNACVTIQAIQSRMAAGKKESHSRSRAWNGMERRRGSAQALQHSTPRSSQHVVPNGLILLMPISACHSAKRAQGIIKSNLNTQTFWWVLLETEPIPDIIKTSPSHSLFFLFGYVLFSSPWFFCFHSQPRKKKKTCEHERVVMFVLFILARAFCALMGWTCCKYTAKHGCPPLVPQNGCAAVETRKRAQIALQTAMFPDFRPAGDVPGSRPWHGGCAGGLLPAGTGGSAAGAAREPGCRKYIFGDMAK